MCCVSGRSLDPSCRGVLVTDPRRRASDNHNHPEYWTNAEHYRFEDRISAEIHNLREDVEAIGTRLTLLLGGLALVAFLYPFVVPWLGRIINVPTQ
jgi:hypothetical protein